MFSDHHRTRIVAWLILAAASPLCIAAAQTPDTTTTKAALYSADQHLLAATAKRGNGAFFEVVEPTAAILMPGQPILTGMQAAAPFASRYPAAVSYRWTPLHAVASRDGKFGCTIGMSRYLAADDTLHAVHMGRYLTCWRQRPDGSWRIVGHQRSDSYRRERKEPFDSVLAPAPHSATFASGDALSQTLEFETLFATMGRAGASGPGPAFVDYAATDAVLMPGPDVAHGKTGILGAFVQWPLGWVLDWLPDRRFGDGSGGLSFTIGKSRIFESAKSDPAFSYGHFMTIWRQEPDGRWRYIFDLGSARPKEDGER